MKKTCPNCQQQINTKKISMQQKNGIHLDSQCPSCDTWFRLKFPLAILKMLGILLLLLTSLLNIFTIKSEFSLLFSMVGFIGIFIALLISFFGANEISPQQNSE